MKNQFGVIVVFLLATASVFAGGGIWFDQDPCDHLWSSPLNWQNGLPSATDDVHVYQWDPSIGMPVVENSGAVGGIVWISKNSLSTYRDGELTVNNGSLSVSNVKVGSGGNLSNVGIFNVNGGTVNVSDHISVGDNKARGYFNMTGGEVTTLWLLCPFVDPNGKGEIYLKGGTLRTTAWQLSEGCTVNFAGGTLIVDGNAIPDVNSFIDNGIFQAYFGVGTVAYDFNNINPGKTTIYAEPGVNPVTYPDGFKVKADTGWDIFTTTGPGSYRYGPTFIINSDDTIDMWTGGPGNGDDEWDWIRHSSSSDDGATWGSETVVLTPNPGSRDANAVCDPGVVKFGGYYYMGYTGINETTGQSNHVFVARSTLPTSGFDKWNGSGWGGDPQPVVEYTGDPCSYGVGEPSFVVKDNTLYMYYTQIDVNAHATMLKTADATDSNWPGDMNDQGLVMLRAPDRDSSDVKYIELVDKFISVNTASRATAGSYVQVWTSSDGISFQVTDIVTDNLVDYIHNMGISGDEEGHIVAGDARFIAYAYGSFDDWGEWSMHLNPVKICDTDYELDFNQDCIVNMEDFAGFAQEWLKGL